MKSRDSPEWPFTGVFNFTVSADIQGMCESWQPGDTKSVILRKILGCMETGAPDVNTFRPGDTINVITRKILDRLGGTSRRGDLETNLWRKILDIVAPGEFRPGDTLTVIERKVLTAIGGTFRPGDVENVILRKILEIGL